MSIICKMKYLLLLISFFSLWLIGSRAVTGVLSEAEATIDVSVGYMKADTVETVTDMGTIRPVELPSPLGMMTFTEVDLMARQFGAHNRSYRLTNLSCSWLSKFMNHRVAVLRMAMLTHSATHVFSTLPLLSWNVSSEHYIFGMRRILI